MHGHISWSLYHISSDGCSSLANTSTRFLAKNAFPYSSQSFIGLPSVETFMKPCSDKSVAITKSRAIASFLLCPLEMHYLHWPIYQFLVNKLQFICWSFCNGELLIIIISRKLQCLTNMAVNSRFRCVFNPYSVIAQSTVSINGMNTSSNISSFINSYNTFI